MSECGGRSSTSTMDVDQGAAGAGFQGAGIPGEGQTRGNILGSVCCIDPSSVRVKVEVEEDMSTSMDTTMEKECELDIPGHFMCKLCQKEFKAMTDFRMHFLNEHQEIIVKTYPCQCCDILSAVAFRDQQAHYESLHPDSSLPCPVCGDWFDSWAKLEYHYQDHYVQKLDAPSFELPNDGNDVNSVALDGINVKQEKTEIDAAPAGPVSCIGCGISIGIPWKCKFCDQRFKGIDHIRKHFKKVHIGRIEKTAVVCRECGKALNYRKLAPHYKKFHIGRPFSCPLCEKQVSNYFTFMGHYREHFVERLETNLERLGVHSKEYNTNGDSSTVDKDALWNVQCISCAKVTLGKCKCTLCGKLFKNACNAQAHIRQSHPHIQKKIYICVYCREAYCHDDRNFHYEMCHNDLPYACPLCDRLLDFGSKHSEYHYSTHFYDRVHPLMNNTKEKGTSEKKALPKCGKCDQTFDKEYMLKAHHIANHGVELKLKLCSTCKKPVWAEGFENHTAQCHMTRCYKCLKCGVSYKLESSLIRHQKAWDNFGVECGASKSRLDLPEVKIKTERPDIPEKKNEQPDSVDNPVLPKNTVVNDLPGPSPGSDSRPGPTLKHDSLPAKTPQSGARRHKCTLCLTKGNLSSLRYHIRKSHKEVFMRTDPCKLCDVHVGYKDMKHHQEALHLSQPYSCPACGEFLKQWASLEGHYLLHFIELKDVKKPVKKRKKWDCEECGARFELKKTQRNHILKAHKKSTRHDDSMQFACVLCGEGFENWPRMDYHYIGHFVSKVGEMTGKHKINVITLPYQCGLCGQRLSSKTQTSKHILRVHAQELEKNHQRQKCPEEYKEQKRILQKQREKHALAKIKRDHELERDEEIRQTMKQVVEVGPVTVKLDTTDDIDADLFTIDESDLFLT